MRIYTVDPRSIKILDSPSPRDISHQAGRLETECQIEPVVVKISTDPNYQFEIDTDHDEHFHLDEAIIQAACWLNWSTVLVTH